MCVWQNCMSGSLNIYENVKEYFVLVFLFYFVSPSSQLRLKQCIVVWLTKLIKKLLCHDYWLANLQSPPYKLCYNTNKPTFRMILIDCMCTWQKFILSFIHACKAKKAIIHLSLHYLENNFCRFVVCILIFL